MCQFGATATQLQASTENGNYTAPKLFYTGMIDTVMDADLYNQTLDCFQEDQQLSDLMEQTFPSIQAQDWDTVMNNYQLAKPMFLADTQKCQTDPQYQAVMDTFNGFVGIIDAMLADDNWQRKVKLALLPHTLKVRKDLNDIQPKWDEYYYCEAGADFGEVLKFALKPWMNSAEEDMFLQ